MWNVRSLQTQTNSLPSCKKRKEKRNPVWNLPFRRDNNNGLYLVFTHSLPSGQSYYNSESFQNSGGRDLLRLVLLKSKTKTQVFVSPHQTPLTSPHLLRKIGSLHLQRDPLSFFPPRNVMDTLCECVRGGKTASKDEKQRNFPAWRTYLTSLYAVRNAGQGGEKYVNNASYCHTKYGNIVTSELWCASGNA